jgi:hypothetical protein
LIAFSRQASARERQQALEFLNSRSTVSGESGTRSGAGAEPARLALAPLAELAHVVLNSNEFVYIN